MGDRISPSLIKGGDIFFLNVYNANALEIDMVGGQFFFAGLVHGDRTFIIGELKWMKLRLTFNAAR